MGAAADKLVVVTIKSTCNSTAIIRPDIAIRELPDPPAIEQFGHRQRTMVSFNRFSLVPPPTSSH
jgi:hypothetical protein